jgi:hypothetical protein
MKISENRVIFSKNYLGINLARTASQDQVGKEKNEKKIDII